ncbi:hypothetical protein [Prevotella sp. 10(H)]|uniref:hypothetical protein n=1 Tax=Prevotella sp. 10(H) TaxID=1158294 RepID=UPI0004A71A90|nr:hypothetical protein [Prevotella sp. 10(H)]
MSALHVDVDKAQLRKLYNDLDPRIKSDAKIILLPVAVSEGKVYAMDNKTGEPVVFDFARATSATYFDCDSTIKSAAVNIPRIDYLTGIPGLLMEPQSTNYFIRTGPGNLGNITITQTDELAFGYQDFVQIASNNSNSFQQIRWNSTSPMIISIALKKQLGGSSSIMAYNAQGYEISGAVGIGEVLYGNASISPGRIQAEKYCNHSPDGTASIVTYKLENVANNGFWGLYPGLNSVDNANKAVRYAMPQQERNRTEATSYIPTTTSQATRSADLMSYTMTEESAVYIKTNKDEKNLTVPEGEWNIHSIMNNERIQLLIIY